MDRARGRGVRRRTGPGAGSAPRWNSSPALAVKAPGSPVARAQARVASGAREALIAAGATARPTLHRATADDPALSVNLRALASELGANRLELAAERRLRRIHG